MIAASRPWSLGDPRPSRLRRGLLTTVFAALVAAATVGAADSTPTLHPKARALPFTHQGPFVATADGGVLGMDAKNAWRSDDEGRTWSASALFAEPEKFAVSNERALLRTREGVIVSAWMNGAERRQPKSWRWGDKDVSWREFVLPTYACRSLDDGKTWEPPVKLLIGNWIFRGIGSGRGLWGG